MGKVEEERGEERSQGKVVDTVEVIGVRDKVSDVGGGEGEGEGEGGRRRRRELVGEGERILRRMFKNGWSMSGFEIALARGRACLGDRCHKGRDNCCHKIWWRMKVGRMLLLWVVRLLVK